MISEAAKQKAVEKLLEFQLELSLTLEQSRKMRKQLELKRKKEVISALAVTIFLHIVLVFNKTFNVNGKKYSSELYHTSLNNAPEGLKVYLIQNATVSYFHFLPDWTPYIFYAIYFVILIWLLVKFNKENV